MSSEDHTSYEERVDQLLDTARTMNICNYDKFKGYLDSRLLPVVFDRVVRPNQEHGLGTNWTNNNCESMNHVLKQAVNWKPQPLLKLVGLKLVVLKGLVQTQNSDVTWALFDLGPGYVVAPGYE